MFKNVCFIVCACVCLGSVVCQYGFQTPYQELPYGGGVMSPPQSYFLSYDHYGTPIYTGYVPNPAGLRAADSAPQDNMPYGDGIPSPNNGYRHAPRAIQKPFEGFEANEPKAFPFHGFNNGQNFELDKFLPIFKQRILQGQSVKSKNPSADDEGQVRSGPDWNFQGIVPQNAIPTTPSIAVIEDVQARNWGGGNRKSSNHKSDLTRNGMQEDTFDDPRIKSKLNRYDWNKFLNEFGQPKKDLTNYPIGVSGKERVPQYNREKITLTTERLVENPTEHPDNFDDNDDADDEEDQIIGLYRDIMKHKNETNPKNDKELINDLIKNSENYQDMFNSKTSYESFLAYLNNQRNSITEKNKADENLKLEQDKLRKGLTNRDKEAPGTFKESFSKRKETSKISENKYKDNIEENFESYAKKKSNEQNHFSSAVLPLNIPTMDELFSAKDKTSNNSQTIYNKQKATEANKAKDNEENLDDFFFSNKHHKIENISTEPPSSTAHIQLSVKPIKAETTTTYYIFSTNKEKYKPVPTSPYSNQKTLDSNKKDENHGASPYINQSGLKDQKFNVSKHKVNAVDLDDAADDINPGMLNSGPEDDHVEESANPHDCIGTEKRETQIEVTFNRPDKLSKKRGTSNNSSHVMNNCNKTSTPKTSEMNVETRFSDKTDEICVTAEGNNGTCMILYSCKPLLEKVARATSDNVKMLRKAHCGFDGSVPKVCCPQPTATIAITTSRPLPVTKRSLPKNLNLEDLFPKPPQCGAVGNVEGPGGRIVGGLPVKLGSLPWMALLGYRSRSGNPDWKCGGSLITHSHILTAAHCILRQEKNLYMVRLGELDTARDDDGATPLDVPIKRMIRHDLYDQKTLTNDIGIVLMETKVQFTDFIKPICLPISEELRKNTFEKYMPVVAGWGFTGELAPETTHLQAVQLPVVTNKFCDEAYSRTRHRTNVIDGSVLCAGFSKGGKDSCQGDSGGPLMQPIWNSKQFVSHFYQIGIVSYGKKCGAAGVPGVYTRVTHFVPWIQQTVAENMDL